MKSCVNKSDCNLIKGLTINLLTTMQNNRNPLIFIVEDNPVYNTLITEVLKSKKYRQVHSFHSTEECFKKIDLNPDIIVLNYAYSGFTGLDLMRKVHESRPHVDFIFLSGQNDVATAVKIIKLGAADYIVKSDKAPQVLVNSIEELISREKRISLKKGLKYGTIVVLLAILVVILTSLALAFFTNIFAS